MSQPIPITTTFIGIHAFIVFVLSYIVVMERTRLRLWHGTNHDDIKDQPNYLENPNPWAAFVEKITHKLIKVDTIESGSLQRKVRAFGNFVEYVPLALLMILVLELMQASAILLWILGIALTLGRITHAWGLIQTYGPSPGRAIGFFLTWFVYLLGAGSCLVYGITTLNL